MTEKLLFKLTPMKPNFKQGKIEVNLFTFGGYTSPECECRLSTQYLQDRITIK